MPNFHPELVAAVTPLLSPSEEVWAVYPSRRHSLVVTASRMFVVGAERPEVHSLAEFVSMQRPSDRLVLLERRAGIALALHIDPLDEHGLQALTVIGLLLTIASKADHAPLTVPPPASVGPAARRVPPMRCRHILSGHPTQRLGRHAVRRSHAKVPGIEPFADLIALAPGAC